jgi:indolepyruvate decarboxylase
MLNDAVHFSSVAICIYKTRTRELRVALVLTGNNMGMYDGRLMDESVRSFVESCDRVLIVGAIMSDFNTGAFTARLDPKKTIDIRHHRTQVGSKVYPNVEMKDILAQLTRRVTKRSENPPIKPFSLGVSPCGAPLTSAETV